MRTRTIVLAALAAGALGVAVRLATTPGGLGAFIDEDAAAGPTPPGVTVAAVGDRLPDLEVRDLRGRPRRLSANVAGRAALINFWASWCGPCLAEMPALDAFASQQGANGVQVVGIALDDPDAVRAFLQRRPVAYPILLDAPGPADASVRLGDVRGVLPYSVLVAADGRILRRRAGPLSPGYLAEWAAEAAPTRD